MSSQGTATINFGAAPGGYEASVAVASAAIGATNLVEAWVYPTATADHSADEHLIDPPRVMAGSVVAGVGFTIYGYSEPRYVANPTRPTGKGVDRTQDAPKYYGQYSVAWVWN
jgi:hypothetical protein